MSLVNLAHVCSHMQNASKARLGFTSVPSSNLIHRLMLSLQGSGFLSYVVRAGREPPTMLSPSSLEPDAGPSAELEPVTQTNVASRRLWLGLKYWNNEPVLSRMSLLSRPTRRVWMDVDGLSQLARGNDANYVRGLRQPGECIYLTTERGVMELRECIERKTGGMLLCRVL